jgi:hypothetical protein
LFFDLLEFAIDDVINILQVDVAGVYGGGYFPQTLLNLAENYVTARDAVRLLSFQEADGHPNTQHAVVVLFQQGFPL